MSGRPSLRLASAAAVVAVALAVTGCHQPPDSRDFELAGALTNEDMPLPNEASASLQYVTADLCSPEVPCVEAWSSDVGSFLRFESIEDAEAYASEAEDAEWDRFVVIDFSSVTISQNDRNDVTGIVFAQMPSESS